MHGQDGQVVNDNLRAGLFDDDIQSREDVAHDAAETGGRQLQLLAPHAGVLQQVVNQGPHPAGRIDQTVDVALPTRAHNTASPR